MSNEMPETPQIQTTQIQQLQRPKRADARRNYDKLVAGMRVEITVVARRPE